MKFLTGYRTLLGILTICAMMVVELWLCLRSANPNAMGMFTALMWPQATCAGLLAGKSATSALAAGGGIKGAVKVLLTDAKPDDAPVPAGTQP